MVPGCVGFAEDRLDFVGEQVVKVFDVGCVVDDLGGKGVEWDGEVGSMLDADDGLVEGVAVESI